MPSNRAKDWRQALKIHLREEPLWDEPMSAHTSLQVGGPADCYIEPTNLDELTAVVQFTRARKVPLFIIGAGTNLLISDSGIRGVVMCLKTGFSGYTVNGSTLIAQSGIMLSKLLIISHEHGLTGLGFLAGIPGTLGGSVFMNAGTSNLFIGDVIQEGLVWNPVSMSVETMHHGDFQFSYRASSLQRTHLILLQATLSLSYGNIEEEKKQIQQSKERRLQTQPLQFPNAGCTWKNPLHDSAGRLIEEAGLKGYTIGRAMISPQHGNFIINTGGATCNDILALMEWIENQIYHKYNIRLVRELQVIED